MTKLKKLMNRIDASIGILNEYHPLSEDYPDYPEHEFSDAIKGIIEATDTFNDDAIVKKKQIRELNKKIETLREKVKELECSLIFSDKAVDDLEEEIRAQYGEKKVKVFKFLRDLMNTDNKL